MMWGWQIVAMASLVAVWSLASRYLSFLVRQYNDTRVPGVTAAEMEVLRRDLAETKRIANGLSLQGGIIQQRRRGAE